MNEKRNDRQQGGMQRDPKQNQPGRPQEDQDRTKTGQPGQPGQFDREKQGQRGLDKGQPQQKPGRNIQEEEVE